MSFTHTHAVRSSYEYGTLTRFIDIEIFVAGDHFEIFGKSSMRAEKDNMGKAGEYLHRVNDVIADGCFILNYDTGAVVYKYYADLEHREDATRFVFEDAFIGTIAVVEAYSRDLAKVLLGTAEPKELIDAMMEGLFEDLEEIFEQESE